MSSEGAGLSGTLFGAAPPPPAAVSAPVYPAGALLFTVLGVAVPKGSTKSHTLRRKDGSTVERNGRPLIVTREDTGRGKPWAQAVGSGALLARQLAGWRIIRGDVPIGVYVRFFVARPKKHYFTGKRADVLRPDAPKYPTSKPDVDKLVRGMLDPLTGVLYADDGQVVDAHGRKFYDDTPRAEVRVTIAP